MEIFERGARFISSATSMFPFRMMLRTYRLLMEIDLLICDHINAVSPAAACCRCYCHCQDLHANCHIVEIRFRVSKKVICEVLVSHKAKQQYQWISFQKDIENLTTIDGDWFSRLRPYYDCYCNHCWYNLIWSDALYLGGFTICFLVLSCLVRTSKKWSGAIDKIEKFLRWN